MKYAMIITILLLATVAGVTVYQSETSYREAHDLRVSVQHTLDRSAEVLVETTPRVVEYETWQIVGPDGTTKITTRTTYSDTLPAPIQIDEVNK